MALIQCPDCASQVSDVAPSCPKCGRPIAPVPPAAVHVTTTAPGAPKKKGVSGLTTLVIFGLLGWFIYGMATSSSSSSSSSISTASDHGDGNTSAPKPIYATTANRLAAEYERNEVAADDAMKGKVVRVSGTIQAIDKDFMDNVVVNLATSNEFMPARMQMVDAEKSAAAHLSKGQTIDVECDQMSRVVGSPSGRNCRFVN
ncbi:MAG TPA: hypothetical protein VGN46_00975 [Luteibacter sp.]